MRRNVPVAVPAMRRRCRIAGLMLLACFLAAPSFAYVVVLKDGTQITTAKEFERKGREVILTMPSGVATSYPASDVDFAKTEELNSNNNLLGATVLETREVREVKSKDSQEPKKATFTDLLSNRGTGLALPEPRLRSRGGADEPEVPTTAAGFTDLINLRRIPLNDGDLVSEIVGYLTGQGDEVKVYSGSRENWPLLEVTVASEASVFKAMKDASSCLVQLRQQFQQLEGFELLVVTDNSVRGGQFSLTPELANELLTGKSEPPSFFLRYVEF